MSHFLKFISLLSISVSIFTFLPRVHGVEDVDSALDSVRILGGPQQLSMAQGSAVLLTSNKRIPRAITLGPRIIEVSPLKDDRLLVSATHMGVTQLVVWDEDGNEATVAINVEESVRQSRTLRELKEIYPSLEIRLRELPSGVVLTGKVQRSQVEPLISIAEHYYPKVINNLKVMPESASSRAPAEQVTVSEQQESGSVGNSAHPLYQKLKEVFPDLDVRVHDFPNGFLVKGTVDNARQATTIIKIAEQYETIVIDELRVRSRSRSAPLPRLMNRSAAGLPNGNTDAHNSTRSLATSRNESLRNIHDEVRALRRDVRRLIQLLESKAQEPPSSNQSNRRPEEIASFVTGDLATRFHHLQRWELSCRDAILMALNSFKHGEIVSHFESDGRWQVFLKPKGDQLTAKDLVAQATRLARDVQRVHAKLFEAHLMVNESRLKADMTVRSWQQLCAAHVDAATEVGARAEIFRAREDVDAAIRKTLDIEAQLRAMLGLTNREGRLIVPPVSLKGADARRPLSTMPTINLFTAESRPQRQPGGTDDPPRDRTDN